MSDLYEAYHEYFEIVIADTPSLKETVFRYDVLYTGKSDRSRKVFASRSGRPAHNKFAKDIAVGLRLNVTPSFILRAEYHRVNGTAWLSTLDNPNSLATSQYWNLFAVQASYRF